MDIQVIQDLVTSWSIILIPVILGIVQVIKNSLPEKYVKFTPLISLVVGIGASVLFIGVTKTAVGIGLILGLSASGLWSTAVSPFAKKEIKS